MKNVIPTFYDLETKRFMEDVNGERIPISCGVVRRDKQNFYYRDDSDQIAQLITKLKESDLIVTYNGISFDNKVLKGYDDFDFTSEIPQYDIMVEIQKQLGGRRVSLNAVVKCNLPGFDKLGSGEQALIWWQQILRCREELQEATITNDKARMALWLAKEEGFWEKLLSYCASDVEALARLLGRVTEGVPIKVQKYWDNMRMVHLKLPNPLEIL